MNRKEKIPKYNCTVTDQEQLIQVMASCKGIRIPQSVEFLLVKSRIMGFGICKTVYGILLRIEIHNPSSTDKDRSQLPGIQNPWRGIENPRLCWIPLHQVIVTYMT